MLIFPPGTTSENWAIICQKYPAKRYVDKGIYKIYDNGKYASPDGIQCLSC